MCLVATLVCVGASIPHVPVASINLGTLGGVDLSDATIKHLIHHQDQTLNAITGDDSWYAKFGDSADPHNATAVERIQVHLNYVRNLLEQKGTEQKQSRTFFFGPLPFGLISFIPVTSNPFLFSSDSVLFCFISVPFCSN